ncbi:septal ring lytic transglycosylase RlpA family protein [Pseudomonas sp. Marseille-QA0892]
MRKGVSTIRRTLYGLAGWGMACISAHAASDAGAFVQKGKASHYSDHFQGKKTTSGERFDNDELSAAHKTLPLGTEVEVTNLENDKKVTVRINDRGPHKPGRVIDLSQEAARKVDMLEEGVVPVKVEKVD